MNACFLLLAESLISVAVSLTALHALFRPLLNALARICPDEQMAPLRLALTAALGGLLIGMQSIGTRLWRFVAAPHKSGSTT